VSTEEGLRTTLIEVGPVKIEKGQAIATRIFYMPETSRVALQIIQGFEEVFKENLRVWNNAIVGRILGTNTYVVYALGEERRRISVKELKGEQIDFQADRDVWKYYEKPYLLFSRESIGARLETLRAENWLKAMATVLHIRASVLSGIVETRKKAIAGTTAPGYIVRCVDNDKAYVTAIKSVLLLGSPKEIILEPIPTVVLEAKCCELEESFDILVSIHQEYFKLIKEEKDFLGKIESTIRSIFVRKGLERGGIFTKLEKMLLGISEEEEEAGEAGREPGPSLARGRIKLED